MLQHLDSYHTVKSKLLSLRGRRNYEGRVVVRLKRLMTYLWSCKEHTLRIRRQSLFVVYEPPQL